MHRRIDSRYLIGGGDGIAGFARRKGVLGYVVDLHIRRRQLGQVAHLNGQALAVPGDLVEARRGRADALRQGAAPIIRTGPFAVSSTRSKAS